MKQHSEPPTPAPATATARRLAHHAATGQAWIEDAIRDLPGLLDPDAVAEFFGVSTRTLARWVRQGRLAVVKLTPGAGSGRVRVPRAEVARLLAAAASPRVSA